MSRLISVDSRFGAELSALWGLRNIESRLSRGVYSNNWYIWFNIRLLLRIERWLRDKEMIVSIQKKLLSFGTNIKGAKYKFTQTSNSVNN